MQGNSINSYRILLPKKVLRAESKKEMVEQTKHYLRKNYPDCTLINIDDKFAICDRYLY